MPVRPVSAGVAALLLLTSAAAASAMSVKQFSREFSKTQNSWERRALIQKLDPGDRKSRKVLFHILKSASFDWYYRQGAIEVLANARDPKVIKKLERVKPNRKPLIAEGVCMAFGKSKDRARLPWMLDCLESRKWICRRAAAIALRWVPDKKGIDALIKAWDKEKKFVVWVHILESLETITRQRDLDTVQKWKDWWSANKDTFEIPSGSDELSEEEKSGELVKTRSRGVDLTYRSRGRGLPLLVLPDYGYHHAYLETYLRELETTNQILYMRLPGVKDFNPPLQNAPNLPQPYYPIDKITAAFESLQETLIKEKKIKGKFAIMAHGISCWIAMKFAEKYRKVRRLILIGANSGDKSMGEGIERLVRTGQRLGDQEMTHYGQSRQYVNGTYKYKAKGAEDTKALDRKAFTVRFGDRRNLEIGRLYGPLDGEDKRVGNAMYRGLPKWRRPMGGCFIPPFSLFKLRKTGTPTLVITGRGAIESSHDDGMAIARHYGRNGRVVHFKYSGEMPFIEENEKFTKIVRKWTGGR